MDKDREWSSSATGSGGFKVDPRFINLRPIGHGGNAVVYAATDSDCEKEVAIKKLTFCDRQSCKYTLREIKIMRRLQHENIVTVYEILGSNGYSLEKGGTITSGVNEVSCVYIVQELLHADLHQLIQQDQLTVQHIQLFTYQLLRGLKYMHSANVIHRDLKPLNLLVNVEDLVLKIADFGLARIVDNDYSHKGFLTDNVGTCWYRSPELIISPRNYTKAIDIWSVGCILAEMFSGRPLFPGGHEMDQIGQILETVSLSDNEWNKVTQVLPQSFVRKHGRQPVKPLKDRFTNINRDALDLMERLLVFDASLRISVEEALAHPFLQPYSCHDDEPIVLRPFHIEHEVDDLSPKSSRRNISNEMSKEVEGCGSSLHGNDTSSVTISVSRLEEKISINSSNISSSNNNSSSNKKPGSSSNNNSCNQSNVSNNRSVRDKNAGNKENVRRDSSDDDTVSEPSIPNSSYIEDFLPSSQTENKTKSKKIQKQLYDYLEKEIDSSDDVDKDFDVPETDSITEIDDCVKKLCVVVDMPEEEENRKEQISPKENKDTGSEKDQHERDNLYVKVDQVQIKKKVAPQKTKDLLNEELRSDSPRENSGSDRIDFIRLEKEKLRLIDRSKVGKKEKKKKKNRRNNRSNSGEDGQDFDTLYRLPTEHLTRHRSTISGKDRPMKTVEEQLRRHEELNERRKMVEMEKDTYVGAVGGYNCDVEESLINLRSRTIGCGNSSPTSEHSRDSSPSTEEPNWPRRFER